MPARFDALRTIRQTWDSSRWPPLRLRNTGSISLASFLKAYTAFHTDCDISTVRVLPPLPKSVSCPAVTRF